MLSRVSGGVNNNNNNNNNNTTVDHIPTELLCYTFTFLHSREDIKSAICVCQRWLEAFTYEEIWKRSYSRFYGLVQKGPTKHIESWVQLFRRRAAQDKYLKKLTRIPKVSTSDEKVTDFRLIGGPLRTALILSGQPILPKFYHLSNDTLVPLTLQIDITTTVIIPSENGRRLLVGNGTGVVSVFEYEETTPSGHPITHNKQIDGVLPPHQNYVRKYLFSDGHNHSYNMTRSIEQIHENERYLVSLAYNNTVAIWEKIELETPDAHSYDIVTRQNMKNDVSNFDFFQFQLQQAANNPGGLLRVPPQPRTSLKSDKVIEQYRIGIEKNAKFTNLIKTLLFKYPPSIVYMMPGSLLQVVIGLRNGKVLVWHTLNNFMLQSHSVAVTQVVGFRDGMEGDTFLVTFSRPSGEFCLWNLNTELGKDRKDGKSQSEVRLMYKVVLTKEYAQSVTKILWSEVLRMVIVVGDKVQLWKLVDKQQYQQQQQQQQQQQECLTWVTQLGEKEKKINCVHLDESRSLLFAGFHDGSIMVYFVPTGQCLLQLPPTKSNQYFSLFHIECDDNTLVAVDDYCFHWKNLGKVYY